MATVKGTEPPFTLREAARRSMNGPARQARHNPPFEMPTVPFQSVRYSLAKRLLDVTASACFIVCFSWLFLLIAVLVKLTSRGPVLFKQERVGRGGQRFTCYKFRSMCVDAENLKHDLSHLNEATGPVFKIKNDPRITPIGRILRKLSLDELPQFFNVVKGEMSLVGPRPPVPAEVAHYGLRELRRLSVKPGLTCLWQISGRSSISFEHWMELDLMYIDTMTFWRDMGIMVKTVPAVISGKGAH